MSETSETQDRGREAHHPTAIPMAGWMDIGARLAESLGRHRASLIAAGLGLFGLLATFPALSAVLALYGLFASPEQVADQIRTFAGVLPDQAAEILRERLSGLAGSERQTLGVGVVAGLAIALWSARKGMAALMAATGIAYDEPEKRGIVRQVLESLAFTAGAVVGFVVILGVAVIAPMAMTLFDPLPGTELLVGVLRWILLWGFVVFALAVIYRYAPDRRPARWRWLTPGSAVAATLWVVGSIAFAFYVRNFGNYGATYGALGGIVVLLLWFYLSGFIVVLGAEINSELEHQTAVDSTPGPDRPMGERGAHVADTVGSARGE